MLANHGNAQTAHFINWCIYSGEVDLPALIGESAHQAVHRLQLEGDSEPCTGCLIEVTEERLSDQLQLFAEDFRADSFARFFGDDWTDWGGFESVMGYQDPEDFVGDPARTLFAPMLDGMLSEIRFDIAARYLMDWHRHHPEAFDEAHTVVARYDNTDGRFRFDSAIGETINQHDGELIGSGQCLETNFRVIEAEFFDRETAVSASNAIRAMSDRLTVHLMD